MAAHIQDALLGLQDLALQAAHLPCVMIDAVDAFACK
jgi:hypothetical protein